MTIQYFKRFRMEYDLRRAGVPEIGVARDYQFVPWRSHQIESHAEALYGSFRFEIDANVFPSLGDPEGCLRLMGEISRRAGFLSAATWLLKYSPPTGRAVQCGSIQGVRDDQGVGCIQNVGVTPEHRGFGLGTALLAQSLRGFDSAGIRRVALEVTAENTAAIRLYERFGFVRARIVYKASDLEFV